ncbi:hypothetical protein Bca4012_032467 [Brassica carinata]|uniref:DUF1216 domain-containing protein n=2 Tax=Brassica TaxID=3705 RepID=A0A3P6C014_BRAOL|nr:uncharacterized protein BNAA04G09680D [Brassica napus]KAH0885580.1 hypothetical protein HID58_061676 [Brassica napus]CAF1858839.1 unnamed protein product [Brassica napus]VDD11583.1 unnamed protein product [Brassica oleracea]
MSRFQNLLCFTILLATVTFFNVASAHVKIKLALPQTGDPISVGDVEPYTVKIVSTFVADLEKECAKTEKFRHFFEKVNAFSKCVCSVSMDHESHMKAKAGSLFQAISALGSDENGSKGGMVNKLQKEKTEAMETVKMLQSIGEKITGRQNKKTEINGTLKLTTKQQKEIKDGILKWVKVITQIAKQADEISMASETKKESKEENSVGPRILVQTKSSTKSDKNSDKKSDNKKNNNGESKKKKRGGKEGRHGSAKSKGGSNDDKSSKNKRKSSENADKNHQTKYGKVEKKKGGVEQSRNKTAERLRAEASDELD